MGNNKLTISQWEPLNNDRVRVFSELSRATRKKRRLLCISRFALIVFPR